MRLDKTRTKDAKVRTTGLKKVRAEKKYLQNRRDKTWSVDRHFKKELTIQDLSGMFS